jgi:hypothetical protein
MAGELAVLAVLCVLTIFLSPAVQGPYSVVHGPVTALQAARAALSVQIAIVQAALSSQGNPSISRAAVFSWMSFPSSESESASLAERSTILRC